MCQSLKTLFQRACRKTISASRKARLKIRDQFLRILDLICEKPVGHPKAETFRRRCIPSAREHGEVFSFIEFDGPSTNNHAERALRPLVIFRKVCLGARSRVGSANISVFSSLTQTAKLQNASVLDLFSALLVGAPAHAQALIFNDPS